MANMKILICIFVFFIFLFPWTQAQQCLGDRICDSLESGVSTCKYTKNCSFCFCDELEDDESNGWKYICVDSCNTYLPLFSVKFVIDASFTIECGEYEPHYQTIFHHVNLTGIKGFSFQNCSLPNTSLSDIIPYREQYTVENIKIEAARGNRTFSSEIFGNLSLTLKNLILSGNNIEMLSESLFIDFTNLKYLSLTDNKLKELHQNIFANTTNLITLEIANNFLESLPEKVFQNLHKLEKLYLSSNKLKELPDNIFKNLVNLKALDLYDNHLMQLPEGVFSGLTSVFHIRLNTNWLAMVPNNLFNGSKNLKHIDLSSNLFKESLPEGLLSNVIQLENISISNCNLSQIHELFFFNCPNLKNINLQRNNLTSLPENIFQNNLMLKEINLNANFLNQLPITLFPNQMHLEKFSICKNNLSFIPEGLFRKARKIKSLDMGRNRIRNASQSLFKDLPSLEILDLSRNNLTHFELYDNEFIKQIDLSFNNLTKFPNINWNRHLRIELLNLDYNKIKFASIPVLFSTNQRTPKIKLANNNITTVSTREISQYEKAIKEENFKDNVQIEVKLQSNPFTCDCKLYGFYNYVQTSTSDKRSARFDSAQSLTCQEPNNLSGKKVMSLSANQFICELKESCPQPCECYYRIRDNSNVINCSYHGLAALPNVIPHNTNILLFQGNSLTHMKYFNEEKWENLTELYLDSNHIQNLDHWTIPVNLKNLSLNDNNFSYVPHSLMNSISNFHQLKMSMSGNPLNCNCSVIDLKKWLVEQSHIITDVQKIMCANQVKMNGTFIHPLILTTPDNILCPTDNWPYKLHLIFVTVTCVVLAFLLVLVSVLYYRNKQTVIAYVYIHMYQVFTCFFSEEDFDEDKMFDAFLSYSSSDRDIALLIREELEDKESHFRICIHERNWIAGNPISWNIFNSVQNSKRTILLISKEFLESMWFQVEFHTAYYQMLEDKIDRLIIIVKGELPPKETMDKDLQYLLTTKTYLVWEEKWFWEKLKYALPHKRHQIVPNDVLALKDRPANEKIKPIETQIAILSNGGTKTNGKFQEAIQNHTNSTMNLVNKESLMKK